MPPLPRSRPPRRRLLAGAAVVAALALVLGCGATGDQPVAAPTSPSTTAAPTRAAPTSAAPSSPTPTSWSVVALGDSVTAGTSCDCTPYPQAYARRLTSVRHVPTTVDNLGVGGLTSADVVTALANPQSAESRAVAGADIDLVTIGANDFGDQHGAVTQGDCLGDVDADDACVQGELTALRENVTAIIDAIHRARGTAPTAILVTGYWNVFEDGDVARSSFPAAGVTATHVLTLRANTEIRLATQADGATYVGLWESFNGPHAGDVTRLLAADGDHPDAQGVAVIVDQLIAAGLPGLTG